MKGEPPDDPALRATAYRDCAQRGPQLGHETGNDGLTLESEAEHFAVEPTFTAEQRARCHGGQSQQKPGD